MILIPYVRFLGRPGPKSGVFRAFARTILSTLSPLFTAPTHCLPSAPGAKHPACLAGVKKPGHQRSRMRWGARGTPGCCREDNVGCCGHPLPSRGWRMFNLASMPGSDLCLRGAVLVHQAHEGMARRLDHDSQWTLPPRQCWATWERRC